MKKALLLVAVLLISVFTTACINNFAVQELNTKAKSFMDKGDYASAIERLKSSIDLDNSIFESHYNLAIAYTKNENYSEAVEAFKDAIEINPDFADSYYSLAVCEENLAKDIVSGMVKIQEDGSYRKLSLEEISQISDKDELADADKNVVYELLTKAVSDYKIYVEKTEDSTSAQQVLGNISSLEKMAEDYKTDVKQD